LSRERQANNGGYVEKDAIELAAYIGYFATATHFNSSTVRTVGDIADDRIRRIATTAASVVRNWPTVFEASPTEELP
jgi:hypothetical protein